MERRKVQVTGGSTYIVSLPKKWVDAQGLQQGDAVDIDYQHGGPATIFPVGTKAAPASHLAITIEPDDHPNHIGRQVISAYLAGYETIEVQAEARIPADQKQAVRQLAQTLIGIEIVEESQSRILLQDLIDPIDFDIHKALQRMQQITTAMVRDALSALVDKDADLAQDVQARDPEVDRLDWMIRKQFHLISQSGRLAGELGIDASQALHHLLVSHAMERIADHASRLGEIAQDKGSGQIGQTTREDAAQHGAHLLEQLDASCKAFHKKDARLGHDAIEACKQAKAAARELLARTKGTPAAAQVDLSLVVESLERIRNYTMDIAEVAIDHVTIRRRT